MRIIMHCLSEGLGMSMDALVRAWFKENARSLPWRTNKTPYRVWVSEIMLQQTQVVKVVDYYEKFTKRFPACEDLARAHEDEVLSLWTGLGYYRRARNLHHAAQLIVANWGSSFPSSIDELRKIPGIGSYTAGAIMAFAFNQPAAVVDGNIARVLARFFGDGHDFSTSIGKKTFEKMSLRLAQQSLEPGVFQEALMEIGALICKPKTPDCLKCPLSIDCFAFNRNAQSEFPVVAKSKEKKQLHAVFVVVGDADHVWLEKSRDTNLFSGLYSPPHVYLEDDSTLQEQMVNLVAQLNLAKHGMASKMVRIRRVLTHRILHMHGCAFRVEPQLVSSGNFVRRDKIADLGMSAATLALLKKTLPMLD